MSALLFYVAITFTVFCAVALVLMPSLTQPSAEAQHLLEVVGGRRKSVAPVRARTPLSERLVKISTALRSRLGFTESTKSRKRLAMAGYRRSSAGSIFFVAQCAVPLVGAFAGSFMHESTLFWMGALALVGFIAPDLWLSNRVRSRQNRIRRSMPDAIDLLVICVDAGLGLDQAMLRVTDELVVSHPEIHQEFVLVNLEQRAGQARLEAWNNLVARTGVDEFASFANMLTQTDRFGTPIMKALTRFSEDLRQRRRQRAEEAAEKTKIKIIFPLVLCIFPCLFIVLLAPALLSILGGLKGIAK